MQGQVTGNSVNVEVDAKPQDDMAKTLEEIRTQYEGIAEKNRREMEAWYKVKVRGTRQYVHLVSCLRLNEAVS